MSRAKRINDAVLDAAYEALQDEAMMPDGFVGMLNAIDAEGKRHWYLLGPGDQMFDLTLGMSRWLNGYWERVMQHAIDESLREDDDE